MRCSHVPFVVLLLLWTVAVPAYGWEVHGFGDLRSGLRLQEAPAQRDALLNEARVQMDLQHSSDLALWQLRADLLWDEAATEHEFDLEQGHGLLDLREANLVLTPLDFLDLKIGRQILTWGTGDLLFINDLFPKDWQSFFLGRDEEYLKAPSDGVLASFFFNWATLDVAWSPCFDADRYISGERMVYWNPMLGRLAGQDTKADVDPRNRWLAEDEISVRLSRTLLGYEWALYGYDGYWKSPVGFDAASGQQYFPRLRVVGGSVRGNFGPGLINGEVGYYDSLEDRNGSDPLVPNSEYRLLVGYEQELRRNLTLGIQYYLEWLNAYQAYRRHLPPGQRARDEDRHVLTLRLTQLALNQNLVVSLFGYWSPSDQDGYLRPSVKYKATDTVTLSVGANLFWGDRPETFFGQFEDNSNLYVSLRYGF
ncbi:MAG: hypothetical protein JXR59_03405 [Desulfuromonadaceae bacterium]|nr:hypothetical protein [Desulfuromonadaceae bacterium]